MAQGMADLVSITVVGGQQPSRVSLSLPLSEFLPVLRIQDDGSSPGHLQKQKSTDGHMWSG